MPPTYRPPQRLGKQPPAVLSLDLSRLADLGDGMAWPRCLVIPTGAGLQCVTLAACHGHQAANSASAAAAQA